MGAEFDNLVSDPGYYLKEEGIEVATFGGKGARLMGLAPAFNLETYLSLFNGQNPYDGSKLTARIKANRRALSTSPSPSQRRFPSPGWSCVMTGSTRLQTMRTRTPCGWSSGKRPSGSGKAARWLPG